MGDYESKIKVAFMYDSGIGIKENKVESYRWILSISNHIIFDDLIQCSELVKYDNP